MRKLFFYFFKREPAFIILHLSAIYLLLDSFLKFMLQNCSSTLLKRSYAAGVFPVQYTQWDCKTFDIQLSCYMHIT